MKPHPHLLSARTPALVATIVFALTLSVPGCQAPDTGTDEAAVEPLFQGIGPHRRAVATVSEDAQRYFDQGLAFLAAFNHDEAIRSFEQAIAFDPDCAMAHWGVAFANGPHINNPVVPEAREAKAYEHAAIAARLAENLDDGPDKGLVGAIVTRYASPQPEDRGPLDLAFAEAMADVYARHPDDPDVGAFYAESLMDLHPWDLYEQDGTPKEWTPAIVTLIEDVLAKHPDHPLANHLYIHAVEASDRPEQADGPADRLRDFAPGLGHLVHMPSHIDVRRGRWQQAIDSNGRAVEADRRYRETTPVPPDFYRLYMSHNHHMKAFAAMMIGQRQVATDAIRALVADIPEGWLKDNALWADGFIAMPYEVLMRFGRWDEILAEPEPADYLPFTRSMHHAARAVAYAALDRTEEARAEQAKFEETRTLVPEDAPFGNNMARDLLGIAEKLVEGEILYREGRADAGIEALYEAAAREDRLRYDEPPGWIQPIRHALGATLLQEGRFDEAEGVFRADLAKHPNNGWGLFGLGRTLRLQRRDDEAVAVEAQFREVWKNADTPLHSACFCQPGV